MPHDLPATIPGILSIDPPDPTVTPAPVVFDSPHSGLTVPDAFHPAVSLDRVFIATDTHVDALFAGAPRHGAPLLKALFPRSFLDVNRSIEDVDPLLLDQPWPGPLSDAPSVRRGMGLIWRFAWGDQPMYDHALTITEVRDRIDRYWWPYHTALAQLIDGIHTRFGQVWHIDCHSMPRRGHVLSPDPAGTERADIVLGDRDGTTCAPMFTAVVADALRRRGYEVAINQPFKGAELVRRSGAPDQGRHSLQIEINRKLYMDEVSRDRTAGFDRLAADLDAVTAEICDYGRRQVSASTPGEIRTGA